MSRRYNCFYQEDSTFFVNADEFSVKHLELFEVRIMAFHFNSDAFRNRFDVTANQWSTVVLMAVQDEVDVVAGDGDEFVQRGFRRTGALTFTPRCLSSESMPLSSW